jgi:hypothetical protein
VGQWAPCSNRRPLINKKSAKGDERRRDGCAWRRVGTMCDASAPHRPRTRESREAPRRRGHAVTTDCSAARSSMPPAITGLCSLGAAPMHARCTTQTSFNPSLSHHAWIDPSINRWSSRNSYRPCVHAGDSSRTQVAPRTVEPFVTLLGVRAL